MPNRNEFLSDVLICAVEGGTGYWASISGYRHSPAAGARATFHPEDEPGDSHTLTIKEISSAIGRICRGEVKMRTDLLQTIKSANRENDAGEIDAEGADVIVQTAIYGEIVYG